MTARGESDVPTVTDAFFEQRLIDLEVKASFAEDLVDELNNLVARQQSQIDWLAREIAVLRRQAPFEEPGAANLLRDEVLPHD